MDPKRLFILAVSAIIILMVSAVPMYAENIDLPPQAEGLVSEEDMVEMIGLMAYARSAEVLAYLDALEQTLTPLINQSRELLGPDMPPITDVSALKASYVARLNAIAAAGSVNEAQKLVAELETAARGLEAPLRGLESEMRALEPLLRGQANVVEQEIRDLIQSEVDAKIEEINAEINEIAAQKAAQIEADTRARVEAAASGINPEDISAEQQAEAQRQLDEFIAQQREILTAEMIALGEAKEVELREWANNKAREMESLEVQKYESLQNDFMNADSRIQATAATQQAVYEEYYDKFMEKKRDVIRQAMQPQLDSALAEIRAHEAAFQEAAQAGRNIIPMDELTAQFEEGWEELIDTIARAEHAEDIDEAVEGFKALWRNRQTELEKALAAGSVEVKDITLQKLAENEAESKLNDAGQKINKLINDLSGKSSLTPDEEEKLRLLKALQPMISDALAMIDDFKQATPDTGVTELLDLKDELQDKLEDIQRMASRLGLLDIPGNGIFIEAENESFTILRPHTACWHSHEELNHPSWRPPLSGGGLWYFSRTNEVLGYYINVETAGEYTIWLRDIASLDWPVGARIVHIFMDGTDLGGFNEHPNRTRYPKGTFDWHPTATVFLSKGQHTLEIKKIEETGAGALIDAIYLTADPTDDPRQMELAE